MLSGIDCFRVFNGVRLHYNSAKYDYFIVGPAKISKDSFDGRSDKWSFVKLGKMVDEKLAPFLFSNCFFKNKSLWVKGIGPDDLERFDEWCEKQKNRLAMFDHQMASIDLTTELKINNGQLPGLMEKVFAGDFEVDNLLVLDHFIGMVDIWDTKLADHLEWQSFVAKFRKYKPFYYNYKPFDPQRFREILKSKR